MSRTQQLKSARWAYVAARSTGNRTKIERSARRLMNLLLRSR